MSEYSNSAFGTNPSSGTNAEAKAALAEVKKQMAILNIQQLIEVSSSPHLMQRRVCSKSIKIVRTIYYFSLFRYMLMPSPGDPFFKPEVHNGV